MWVFLSDVFVSIVAPKPDSGIDPSQFLIVRARVKGDIERLFPGAKVMVDAGTDYRFRAIVLASTVARTMADAVHAIEDAALRLFPRLGSHGRPAGRSSPQGIAPTPAAPGMTTRGAGGRRVLSPPNS